MATSQTRRIMRQRQFAQRRESVNELEKMYFFLQFMMEDIEEKIAAEKKKDEEKAKNAPPPTLFARKFTFGQTVMAAWIVSLPLSVFWLTIFWRWM